MKKAVIHLFAGTFEAATIHYAVAKIFGPVVPNVYYHYCGFGAMPISIIKDTFSIVSSDAIFIDKIVEEKRKLNPWDMVAETHKEEGAWAKVYRDGLGNHCIIPIELIKAVG